MLATGGGAVLREDNRKALRPVVASSISALLSISSSSALRATAIVRCCRQAIPVAFLLGSWLFATRCTAPLRISSSRQTSVRPGWWSWKFSIGSLHCLPVKAG